MKNTPRLYIDAPMSAGVEVALTATQRHYLAHVMRCKRFLAFCGGAEYEAEMAPHLPKAKIIRPTKRKDTRGGWTLCFAPIKRVDELASAATQLGAKALQPVITDYTVAHHVNWERVKRVIIEAAEQSGLNSLPELMNPVAFVKLDKKGVFYGDERAAHGKAKSCKIKAAPKSGDCRLLVGPEGGFSKNEFAALEEAGAIGVPLGRTILRSEVAAVALAARILLQS